MVNGTSEKSGIAFGLCLGLCLLLCGSAVAQFSFPDKFERPHPRLLSPDVNKSDLQQKIRDSEEVQKAYDAFKKRVSGYVMQHETDPEWMVSRLQMYWKSHATDVYINGEYYSHAEGKAPVPTVRFTGSRDYVTNYQTPKLEDIKPYMDDERGLYVQNKKTNEWEWAEQSKTGRVVENINKTIMSHAADAALVYYIEGDERYARFAAHLFDVYMQGIYYRKVPQDLKRSGIQNLVGYTSFQVIKEGVVSPLVSCYDYLYDYLNKQARDKMPLYATSFKKMAEQIIKNGVPNNNWNLIQTEYVIQIAFILENDTFYEDGRGSQHYLDRIFNKTEARQWSITDLLAHGYDPKNGVWEESPGYSLMVARDFTSLASVLQEALNVDILPQMPIVPDAVRVMPQYLYPNNYIVAFGDTHYGKLSSQAMMDLVDNAQRFNKSDQEKEFTALARMVNPSQGGGGGTRKSKNAFQTLLAGRQVKLDDTIASADLKDYVTSTFNAQSVSWVVQCNGFDSEQHGLMISQAGSLGNHMHSNGIAMELYGKGYVLAPEGGRGSSYFQPDYKEYYSQFPAHNTVVVNGASNYRAMRSRNPFEVKALYPASGRKSGYYSGITFSDLYFHEPKTNADQNRVMSIVRTGPTTGYYIDIFRSKCQEGNDKYHDYFYHNLGQDLSLTNTQGDALKLTSSERLTSANGNLKAYDYLTDKYSVKTDKDFKATFDLRLDGEEPIRMNMTMIGNADREVFKVKSPRSEALRSGMIPRDLAMAPIPTVVVRQSGQAWKRPFVCVYEPSTESESAAIKNIEAFQIGDASDGFVGLQIESLSGRIDTLFSSDIMMACKHRNLSFEGTFGMVIEEQSATTLFIGSGKMIEKDGYALDVLGSHPSSAALVWDKNSMHLMAESAVLLTIPDRYQKGDVILTYGANEVSGQRQIRDGIKCISFDMPAISYQKVTVKNK